MPAQDSPFAPPLVAAPVTADAKGVRTAALGARMAALVIDYLLSAAALYGGAWVLYLLGVRGMGILIPAVFVLAKPVCEACGGRTPGKALFGARVVDVHRRPIGLGESLIRNLGWVLGPGITSFLLWIVMVGAIPAGVGGAILSLLALIGSVVWILSCLAGCFANRRAWHDRLAGTTVVQGWSPAAVTKVRRTRRRDQR